MRSTPAVLTKETTLISECLDRLAKERLSTRPLATYRLQFNSRFRFEDARRLAGYLHALGISHVYSSPVLQACAGSSHGYDITDHNRLNPEVGSYEDLEAMVRELKSYGMGLVLDFVPNHMGVGKGSNPWWQDVLANGRASEFTAFFDLDWNPLKPELRNKLLLPVLSDQYGAELEAGTIRVVLHDADDGVRFQIVYRETTLPLDPQTIPMIFPSSARNSAAAPAPALGSTDIHANSEPHGPELDEFRRLLDSLRSLPTHSATDSEKVQQRRRSIPPVTTALGNLIRSSPRIRQLAEKSVE